jgi:hypothetical protein
MADTSTRFVISEPSADRHDAADVPLYVRNIVAALEARGTVYGQGLLSARPVSTGGSPGVQGRVYYATDTSALYYDFGTGWTQIGSIAFSGYGTLASRPTASTQPEGWFYYATDTKVLYQNEAGTWTQVSASAQYTTSVGDGVSTSYAINHNLGSQNVVVQVRQAASPFAIVHPDIQVTDANNVTLVFDLPPSSGQYSVTVLGGSTGAAAVSAHATTHLPNGSDALAWGTIHGRGTLAARPAAGATNSGLRYVATDVYGGTEYQSDGAAWNQISAPVNAVLGKYRKVTAKQVVNTVVETDLLNGEIIIAANAIGASGVLRLTLVGDMLNNTGAGQSFPRFALRLGAANTIIDTNVLINYGSSSIRNPWKLDATIANLGATNSQWTEFLWSTMAGDVGTTAVAPIVGNGYGYMPAPAGGVGPAWYHFCQATTIDTTIAQQLVFSVVNGVAHVNYDVTLRHALVEII